MDNYSKILDTLAQNFREEKRYPRLLLHACCAPCSSYCLEYLREYFDVTVFYYNPNITSESEYEKRVSEEKRLIAEYNRQVAEQDFSVMGSVYAHGVSLIEGKYEPERFLEMSRGLEGCPERGERCERCFRLRLSETAKAAALGKFDFFTTTLTISPLKDSSLLNRIGCEAGTKAGVSFLPSDFKKRNGYKRSIELSKQFGLYRQDYCGCSFSKAERMAQKAGNSRYRADKQQIQSR